MRSRRLRAHLVALVISALVPVLLFALVLVFLLDRRERIDLEGRIQETARTLSLAIEREHAGPTAALEALATSRSLDNEDLPAFYEDARRVQRSQKGWLTIALLLPSGEPLMDLRRPLGSQLPPLTERASLERLLHTGTPRVGELSVDALTGEWGFALHAPVVRNGVVKYLLTALISPAQIHQILAGMNVSDEIIWVIDQKQQIVSRMPSPEAYVGRKPDLGILTAMSQAQGGWAYARTFEDSDVYLALSLSPVSGWSVAVAVPADTVNASLRRSLIMIVGWGVIALLAAVCLALLFGRRVTEPILGLASSADPLAEGRIPAPKSLGVREVNQVADALAAAGTARRQAEESLRVRSEQLRVTLSNMRDAVIATDVNGRVMLMNAVAQSLTGWPEEEAKREMLHDVFVIVDEQTRLPVEHPAVKVMREGTVVGAANLLIAKDGTERPIGYQGAPIRNDRGQIAGMVVVFHDATALRLAGAELRESERQFNLMADTVPAMIWLSGPDSRRNFFNRHWLEFTGLTMEEGLSAGWAAGVHPDDIQRCFDAYLSSFDDRKEFKIEYRLRCADGAYRWVLDIAVPRVHADGSFAGYIGSAVDITELKLAEEERTRLLEREAATRREAEAANRAKDEFLANLSHELRAPLNVTLGWVRMLRMGTLDASASAKALETIERNTKLQARLIEDLLDLSRIITGTVTLNLRPVELAPIVEAVLDAAGPTARLKDIEIEASLDRSCGPVIGDAERLQQVVWNLVSNAITFTPRHGRISVSLRRVDSMAEIAVRDTGAGIKPEFLPHLFDRFDPAETSTKGRRAGLGLVIVKRLVELHGGTIHVESPGERRGATFRVRLPLPAVEPQGREERLNDPPDRALAQNPVVSLTGLTVLLVVEEADDRDLFSTVLRRRGADVITATSTAEALELLEQRAPDVLVSEIGTTDEDGDELMRRVRELPPERGGRIPALALTAYATLADRDRVLAAGYQLHRAKPVEPLELAMLIARLAGLIGA